MSKNIVVYYEDKNGDSPVKDFLYSLQHKAKDKALRALEPLVEFGLGSHILNTKKLVGTPLWEVRVLGRDSIRVLFAVVINGVVLILHGFVKKSQKTPLKEINTGIRRLAEWKMRH